MGNKLGIIKNLYITKAGSSSRDTMLFVDVKFGGIKEDKFFQKDTNREILISSILGYEYAKSLNMPIQESDLGENILVDFDIKQLHVGSIIQIGETILEISMECPICNHLSHIDKKFPKLIKNDRGIFARVKQEGIIHVNDSIVLLQ